MVFKRANVTKYVYTVCTDSVHATNGLSLFYRSFSLDGTKFKILGPKYDKLWDPLHRLLMLGIENWGS